MLSNLFCIPYHPWDWQNYLHERLIFRVNICRFISIPFPWDGIYIYISNHFYFPPSPNTPTTHPDPDPSPPHPKAATAAPPPRRSPPRGAPRRRRSVPSGISARHLSWGGQNSDRRSMDAHGKNGIYSPTCSWLDFFHGK